MNNYTFNTSKFNIVNPELADKLNKEMQFNGLGFEGLGNVKVMAIVAESIVNHRGKVYNNLKLLRDYMYSGGMVHEKTQNRQRDELYKYLTDVTNEAKFYQRLNRTIASFQKQHGQVSIRKTKYEVKSYV